MARASNRVIRSVSLRVAGRRFTVVESRARELLLLVAVTGAFVALWFAFGNQGPDGRRWFFATMGVVLWLPFAWMWLPWNARVVLDPDLDECRVSWRFFVVPIKRDRFELSDHKLAAGSGTLSYGKTVPDPSKPRDETMGCLVSLLLGPLLAALVSSQPQRKITVTERHRGLTLRGAGGEILLLAVRDEGTLEDVLADLRQLAPEYVA